MSEEPEYPISFQYARTIEGRTQIVVATENATFILEWVPETGVAEGQYLIENIDDILASIAVQEGFINVEQEVDSDPAGQ